MKALLLCGYRDLAGREKEAAELIDRRLRELSALKLAPICVLSGKYADDLLRACPRIGDAELVFDTTEAATLASNLQAGLAGTEGEACFVLPFEVPPVESGVWYRLRDEWVRLGLSADPSVLQAVDAQGAPWHYGFPLLVTLNGNREIRELRELRSLTDPRLRYLSIAAQTDVASTPNPL